MTLEPKKNATLRCWVAGLGCSLVLCVLIMGFGNVHTALNDDVILGRALSGFSGEYPAYLPHVHSLLRAPLIWLHQHVPGIHWFSWFMLGAFYASLAVILKCLLQCAAPTRLARITAVAAWLVCFGLLFFTSAVSITYTVVSTLLGCAAAAQILSFDPADCSAGQMSRTFLLAFCLAAAGYALRLENLPTILCYCGFAAFWQFGVLFEKKKPLPVRASRNLLLCSLSAVLGIGLLAGWNWYEARLPQNRELTEWTHARIQVTDYQGWEDMPASFFEQVGWTVEGEDLYWRWYYLDSAVTTEAFEKIAQYQQSVKEKTGLAERVLRSQGTLWQSLLKTPALLAALAGMVICLGLIWRRISAAQRWIAAASMAVSYLLLSYLAFRGRTPFRAMIAVIGPEAILLLMITVRNTLVKKPSGKGGLVVCLLLALVAFGSVGLQAKENLTSSFQPLRAYRLQNAWSAIDNYAVENPDTLFIMDSLSDDRLFPDMKNGRLTNVMYYGGWQAKCSDFEAQLRRYGIDPDHMDGRLFLQSNVRLVSMNQESIQVIQTYIQSLCNTPVEMVVEDAFKAPYWVWIVRFQLQSEQNGEKESL